MRGGNKLKGQLVISSFKKGIHSMLSMMNVHLRLSRTRPVTDLQHFERQSIPLLELSLLYSHTTLFWMKIYLWIITIHGNSLCYPKQHNWLWSLCPILERTSVFLNLALNSWNIASFLNFSSYDTVLMPFILKTSLVLQAIVCQGNVNETFQI